jgi:serine protease Do
VQVLLDDGTQLEAKVVGTDKGTDLALLKVPDRNDLPFVKLAADSPKIGSWVVAMGNPFGLGGTVTSGIVSAKGRDIGNGPYDDYIQIDAPVNRGNSGGPTFDMKGEVIGINTAIYSPSGGSVGIAFDIPAATVKMVVTQLRERGHVERGWLGVQVQPVTQAVADSLGLKAAKGALISEPQPNGPAAKAGLKSGDIVDAINGKKIDNARALARTIASFAPGTSVTLSVLRNGKSQEFTVTLGEFKDESSRNAQAAPESGNKVGKLGLRLAPAASVEGAGNEGVAVLGVDPGSEAADAGISAGDVILKAGGTTLSSAQDLQQALAQARSSGKKHTLALVRHDNQDRYVALPVPMG